MHVNNKRTNIFEKKKTWLRSEMCMKFFTYYDCSLQLLRFAGIALMQCSIHVHHEHWKYSHSAGQTELTWVQNGTAVFEKAQLTNNNIPSA